MNEYNNDLLSCDIMMALTGDDELQKCIMELKHKKKKYNGKVK